MTTMTLARIDEEIIRQKLALSNLSTRRNSLSFVFRLPTEILETIFIHCARNFYKDRRYRYSSFLPPYLPHWVDISYVCRRWRDVALNCPTLWTYILTTSWYWTEVLLARSKNAPLKIYVDLGNVHDDRYWVKFVEKVVNHIERIQEFCFYHSHTRIGPLFSKLFSSRAPCLQNLEISSDVTPSEWSSVPFRGDTPALRTLDLSRCAVPWYSLKLSGLTTLGLHHVPVRFQQSAVEFLAVLSRMQDLTRLYLDHALASAREFISSTAFHAFRKINLPRLSRLLVVAPLSMVVALLSCVNIPLKVEVRIERREEDDSSLDDYTQLCTLLAQIYSASEDQAHSVPTIRSLVISRTYRGQRLTFSASERYCNSSDFISHVHWGCDIPLQIVVDLGRSTTSYEHECRIASNICCSMPLANVQSVHVSYLSFSSVFWKDAVGHLQDLRYIKLSWGLMPDLASLLSLTPHDFTGNQGGQANRGPLNQIFAPALEELELSDTQFPTTLASDFDPPAANPQSLFDALSTRKEPRGRLTMTWCDAVNEYHQHIQLNTVVGWWGGGCFHVVDDDSVIQ